MATSKRELELRSKFRKSLKKLASLDSTLKLEADLANVLNILEMLVNEKIVDLDETEMIVKRSKM